MVSDPIVYVGIHRPVQADTVWVRKDFGVSCRRNKTTKHLVARLDRDSTVAVVEDVIDLTPTITAKGSVQADTLVDIAKEHIVGFFTLNLGESLNVGKVLETFVTQVIVHDLAENLGLVGDHRDRRRHDLAKGHIVRTHTGLAQAAYHVDTVICQGIFILPETVKQFGRERGRGDRLDVHLDQFPKHVGQLPRHQAQLEGLCGLKVEEYGREDDAHGHPQFLFAENPRRVLRRLQWEGKNVGGEMHMREVSHVSRQVDLIDVCDPAAVVMQQADGDVLVKGLDVFVPLFTVQQPLHELPLLAMEAAVTSQAELLTSRTHDKAQAIVPHDGKVLGALKQVLCTFVRRQVYPRWYVRWGAPVVVVVPAKVLHDLCILARYCHGVCDEC